MKAKLKSSIHSKCEFAFRISRTQLLSILSWSCKMRKHRPHHRPQHHPHRLLLPNAIHLSRCYSSFSSPFFARPQIYFAFHATFLGLSMRRIRVGGPSCTFNVLHCILHMRKIFARYWDTERWSKLFKFVYNCGLKSTRDFGAELSQTFEFKAFDVKTILTFTDFYLWTEKDVLNMNSWIRMVLNA